MLNRALLRRYTHLTPLQRNATRWSSEYSMLKRFFELLPHLTELPDLVEILPSPAELAVLRKALSTMESLDSVTKMLQSNDLTVADVRDLFDGVIEKFPAMVGHLGASAAIVTCPNFESGVVKLLRGTIGALSKKEAAALAKAGLKRANQEPVHASATTSETPASLAATILKTKRRRIDSSAKRST